MRRPLLAFITFLVCQLSFSQVLVYMDQNIPIENNEVGVMEVSTDGRFVAIGLKKEGKIILWDLIAKRQLHELNHDSNKPVTALLFDSKNQYLVSGSEDKKIILWDLYSGTEQKSITEYGGKISHLSLNPEENLLAVGGSEREVYIFNFPDGSLKGVLKGAHKKGVFFTSFNRSGTQLVSVGYNNEMAFWDPFKLILIRKSELSPNTIPESGITVTSASTTVDKRLIGIGYEEVKLAKGGQSMIFRFNTAFYDWETGMLVKTIEGNAKKIDFISMSGDGNYYLTDNSTVREKKITIWNYQTGVEEQKQVIEGDITNLTLSDRGDWMGVAYESESGGSGVSMYKLSGLETASISQMLSTKTEDQKPLGRTETTSYNLPTITTDGKVIISEGKYYGLIIGINDYQDPMINDLDEPLKDAQKLYDILTGSYTFEPGNIIFLKNPTYEEMITALDNLERIVTLKDNLLIFYAGHGHWDENAQRGYWLPSDAKQQNTANWFRNSTLSGYISSIKSNHTLLIADACFSGGIFKTRAAFGTPSMAIQKLYELPSRKAMTSGTLKEVPDKSVFLQYLTKRLIDNEEQYLPSEQLFYSFKPAVLNNSINVPQFGEIKNAGDEGGDFIFIKKE